jgi:hypothetical protein
MTPFARGEEPGQAERHVEKTLLEFLGSLQCVNADYGGDRRRQIRTGP